MEPRLNKCGSYIVEPNVNVIHLDNIKMLYYREGEIHHVATHCQIKVMNLGSGVSRATEHTVLLSSPKWKQRSALEVTQHYNGVVSKTLPLSRQMRS